MPAAVNKAEIIASTDKEWRKLTLLLDTLTPKQAVQKFEGDTSIKDVIAHRAHWIDLFLGWYSDGAAGREVHAPARGYKWNQLKAYNQALRERQSHLSWDQARAELESAHARLIEFYVGHSDAEMYGVPMKGGNGKWTAGRYSEASGASHFRSAAKFVRQCIRAGEG